MTILKNTWIDCVITDFKNKLMGSFQLLHLLSQIHTIEAANLEGELVYLINGCQSNSNCHYEFDIDSFQVESID